MARNDSTSEQMRKIQTARSLTKVLREIKEASDLPTIGAYLEGIHKEKGLKKEQLFASVGISTVYGYEILRGAKIPSRDTLIRFAFALKMDVDETQELLKIGEKAPLYPKLSRDALIIYALSHGLTIIDLNIAANDKGIHPIGKH